MDHILNVRLVTECTNKSFEIILNTIYLVLMPFYDEMLPEKGTTGSVICIVETLKIRPGGRKRRK